MFFICDYQNNDKISLLRRKNFMFENKKMCPKCGNIEPDTHLFCSQCGAKLDISFSDEENTEDNAEEKSSSNKHPVITVVVLLTVLYFIISFVVSNFLSKIGSEVSNDLDSEESTIDKCSEYDIKKLAIDSFKERDYYFRYLLPKSVANIYLNDTSETSHFLDSNKYYCRGVIEVVSEANGFEPKENSEDNPFYAMIFHSEENPVKEYFDKYTSYTCEIEYTVENPEGSVKVEASYCGSGRMTDTAPPPEFSCEGICDPIILKEEQPAEETTEEQQAEDNKSENTDTKPAITDVKSAPVNNGPDEITNETKIRQSIEQKSIYSEPEDVVDAPSDSE
jgi:hypothetical protein